MYTCHIFNLFFVNENSIETIEFMINDFTYFGEEFSDMFGNSSSIQKTKDEVPSVKEMTNRPFNWDGMEIKKLYKN